MHAIYIEQYGNAETLTLGELNKPVIGKLTGSGLAFCLFDESGLVFS